VTSVADTVVIANPDEVRVVREIVTEKEVTVDQSLEEIKVTTDSGKLHVSYTTLRGLVFLKKMTKLIFWSLSNPISIHHDCNSHCLSGSKMKIFQFWVPF